MNACQMPDYTRYAVSKSRAPGFGTDFEKARKELREGRPLGPKLPNGLYDVPEDLLISVGKGPEPESGNFSPNLKTEFSSKAKELLNKYKTAGKGIIIGAVGPEALSKGKELVDSFKEQTERVVGTATDSAKTVIEKAGDRTVGAIEKVTGNAHADDSVIQPPEDLADSDIDDDSSAHHPETDDNAEHHIDDGDEITEEIDDSDDLSAADDAAMNDDFTDYGLF